MIKTAITESGQYYNEQLRNQDATLAALYTQKSETQKALLEQEYKEKKANIEVEIQLDTDRLRTAYEQVVAEYQEALKTLESEQTAEKERIHNDIKDQMDRLTSLMEPIKLYEKETQAAKFYTIQVPEEYQSDIEFLLTSVAPHVAHPDIINKLIWTEYVRPYIEDTFKRVGIEDKPGIYKLTNMLNKKSYIGKSTNIKKRIADHFKSVVGIQSIADQAVHHEILKTGLWNWAIEVIIYCDKDKLSELEKYYIDFFKTQEYGYNRTSGG